MSLGIVSERNVSKSLWALRIRSLSKKTREQRGDGFDEKVHNFLITYFTK
jgi:hypothetical protein